MYDQTSAFILRSNKRVESVWVETVLIKKKIDSKSPVQPYNNGIFS